MYAVYQFYIRITCRIQLIIIQIKQASVMKFNIIIIDDSLLQLAISSRLIRKNKNLNLIGSYSNPFLGLNAVNNSEVDIVLLDVEMPQIDGFSLQKSFNKQVEVIINSTKPSFETKAYYTGAVDFLNKPINESRFNSAVDSVITSKNYVEAQENNFAAFAS